MWLSQIYRYPVKSCRGESVSRIAVEPWGLAGDRRWMLVDEGGETVTAREHPTLLLVTPTIQDGGLRLSTPGVADLHVPAPDAARRLDVTVFKRTPFSTALGAADAHEWFSRLLDIPVRLVYTDDPRRRPTNPSFSAPGDCVSFADGYPLLAATQGSLDEVNKHIATGPLHDQGPIDIRRFRPNLVLNDSAPWHEDGWRRVRIGAATFRAIKGCDRCVMTTINPDTAARGKEPIATLARIRRWDGAVWFGVNLIPDTPGAVVAVGDDVEVLESSDHLMGPLR